MGIKRKTDLESRRADRRLILQKMIEREGPISHHIQHFLGHKMVRGF